MINKSQLKEILSDLIDISNSLDLDISANTIFEQGCTFQRGLLAQEGKVSNMKFMKNISKQSKEAKSDEPKPQKQAIKPASNRQLLYLSKLGYKGNMNLNSSQADLLIKEYTKGGE